MPTPKAAVADTNIYRSLPPSNGRDRIREHTDRLLLSPLNVFEIMGVRDPEDLDEFAKRVSGAKKMLDWADGWVVDPECYQARLLGVNVGGYRFDDFQKGLKLLADAKAPADLEAAGNYVNLKLARTIRNEAYGAFTEKMEVAQKAFQRYCDEQGIDEKERRKERVILDALQKEKIETSIQMAEFKRIRNVVKSLSNDKSLASGISGKVDLLRAGALKPYTHLYFAYLVRFLLGAKLDENDFGDLQFAIYACGGEYKLLTQEKRWRVLSENSKTTLPLEKVD